MTKPPSKAWSSFVTGQILWFFLVAGLWIGFLFLSPTDRDYTSGELVDHVMAWSETGPLYHSIDQTPYRVLNYPPVFLWLVKEVLRTGISPLTAGRLLNLIAFALSSGVLFRWMKKEGCGNQSAAFITALLATSFPFLYSSGQFHLELLGISFSLAGLFLLQAQTPKRRSLILGGLLCALACFVKQTQVISALIGLVWLLRYRPKQALYFGLSGLITSLLGGWLLNHFFGREVFRHLLTYTVGGFSFSQLSRQLIAHLLPWIVFVLLAFGMAWRDPEEKKTFRWWYFIGMTLWLLSSSRQGSGEQYFIEWSFATLLWIGPFFARGLENPRDSLLSHPVWTTLLLIQILVADFVTAGVLLYNVECLRKTNSLLPQMCELLKKEKRIVIEEPGMARACGVEPALHPFIMTSLAKQGLWDERPFVGDLSRGWYPLVALPFDPQGEVSRIHEERWSPAMLKAFREHYQKNKTLGEWTILEYRSPAS